MARKCTKNWISTYLQYTTVQKAPERYHLWIAISIIASTMERNCYIDRGFYTLYPNLYVAIVGPTAFLSKSTAGDIGTEFLEKIPDITIIRGKATSWWMYRWLGGKSASGEPCTCTIWASEMKSFLDDLGKTEMVTMLTDMYGCPDSRNFYTIKGGMFTLKNICINVLAASTPEWLTTGTSMDDISGGFTGRFVYVYADSGERHIPFPEDEYPKVAHLKQPLEDDLIEISKLKGEFLLTPEAKKNYTAWYNDLKNEFIAHGDERMMGYFGRKGELVLKVAMIISAATNDDKIIDEKILSATWSILRKIEDQMTLSFAGIVGDPSLRWQDKVLGQLARAPGGFLTTSELLRYNWNRFNSQTLDSIMRNLGDMNVVASEHRPGKGMGWKLTEKGQVRNWRGQV